MNLEAVYHRAKLNWSYAYDEHTLHIRIRTKKDDIKRIDLYYGDKYGWDTTNAETQMVLLASDAMFDYWEAAAQPVYRRLVYYFALNDGERTVYFQEKGFFDVPPVIFYEGLFDFPFLNPADVHTPPAWVKKRFFIKYFQNDLQTAIQRSILKERRNGEASLPQAISSAAICRASSIIWIT